MKLSLIHNTSDMHVGGFLPEAGYNEDPKELFHLVTLHKKHFAKNLEEYREEIVQSGEYKEIQKGVYLPTHASINDHIVFDTTKGIIVIEKNVTIMPFTYLAGPLRIDEGATINPHSNISGSYIGKFCKIGGEVSNSVFEAYSNKGHYGYVGDSYVGSWVNLGGGTATSNLKNTYGTIKMDGVETGEQFIGSIIADHVKTALNTAIYTGKIIGMGAHIYGTVTTDVPPCVNYYGKDNMIAIPFEVIEKTATRMMARRGVVFNEGDKKTLQLIYNSNE